MIGTNIQNSPNGDLRSFSDVRALGQFDVLEAGGAVQSNPSSGNQANANAVATIAAATGRMNFATGFEITFAGATAAGVVLATLTGLLGGTQTFVVAVPAGATLAGAPLVVAFPKALQASAVNVAIVLTLPALGTGNTNACVNLHGFSVEAS